MDATNEGNSFHFGVNFEERVEDEKGSSQELREEDLNNIVEEYKPERTKKCNVGIEKVFQMDRKREQTRRS